MSDPDRVLDQADRYTRLVGFWRRVYVTTTLINMAVIVAFLAFGAVTHASKQPWDTRAHWLALYWVVVAPLVLLAKFASVQQERALDRHPLAYLIRLQRHFG